MHGENIKLRITDALLEDIFDHISLSSS